MSPISTAPSNYTTNLSVDEWNDSLEPTPSTSMAELFLSKTPPPAQTGWVSWIKSWFSSPTPTPKPVDLDPIAISSIPLLDPPSHLLPFSDPQKACITDAILDPILMQHIVSHMKEITVQEIFTLLIASEMSLSEERASVVNDSEKIAFRIKKLHDINKEKILKILQKDEQLAKYFTFGKNIAATCSVVAACASLIPPIAALGSPGVLQIFLGIGSLVASTGEGIFQYRIKETQQQTTLIQHTRQSAEDQLQDTRSRLIGIAESHGAMQQQFIYYIKSISKLSSIINAKN